MSDRRDIRNKKNKIRYARRKPTKNERDIMSYEDMPLDDYEQEKTEISPAAVKKIIVGICIALAAGLLVFAFANRDKLTWDNISTWWTYDVLGNAGHGYPVNIVGSEVSQGNFAVSQGHVAYSSDTSFITLNSSGSEIANFQLRHSTPVMKSSGNRFLTYGIDTKDFEVNSIDKNLFKGEAEGNIYTGDIASNGTYCFVTEGSGYLSVLYVFNSNNNRIYKYYFSEYYITSVSLKEDGSGCIACGFTTYNGAMLTGVYVLDFDKDKPVSSYKIPNDGVIDCKYLSSNRAVVIGQTASYIIKVGDKDYITDSYEDKSLANYCINPDNSTFTLALSRSGDGRSVELSGFNDNGENMYKIATDYKADSISVYKGTIAVLDGNTVYAYNQNGNLLYTANAGTGSKKIILTSDKHAYVLSVNQVRFIDLSNTSTDDTAHSTSSGEDKK